MSEKRRSIGGFQFKSMTSDDVHARAQEALNNLPAVQAPTLPERDSVTDQSHVEVSLQPVVSADHTPSIPLQPPSTQASLDTLETTRRRVPSPSRRSTRRSASPPGANGRSESETDASFSQALKGMIFVISGIQNPKRTELRSKAIQMGAKYRPAWSSDATHLICPFPNTPKYNEVLRMGNGLIVVPEYVDACYRQRRRLKEDDYLLDIPPPVYTPRSASSGPLSSLQAPQQQQGDRQDTTMSSGNRLNRNTDTSPIEPDDGDVPSARRLTLIDLPPLPAESQTEEEDDN